MFLSNFKKGFKKGFFLSLNIKGQQKYAFPAYSISSRLIYIKVYYSIWSYKDMLEKKNVSLNNINASK